MKKFYSASAALLVFALAAPYQLSAQRVYTAIPGQDIASLALNLGAVLPSSQLPDGSSFDSGFAGGVTGTVWPHRHLGVRGSFLYAASGVSPGAGSNYRVAFEEPDFLLYSMELAARYPIQAGRFVWSPYLAGGSVERRTANKDEIAPRTEIGSSPTGYRGISSHSELEKSSVLASGERQSYTVFNLLHSALLIAGGNSVIS